MATSPSRTSAASQRVTASRGAEIVADYVSPASATDDRRPEFQRMIDAATQATSVRCYRGAQLQPFLPRPFSRFYVRRLAKNGVRLVSSLGSSATIR
jgi:hypothetical protein